MERANFRQKSGNLSRLIFQSGFVMKSRYNKKNYYFYLLFHYHYTFIEYLTKSGIRKYGSIFLICCTNF